MNHIGIAVVLLREHLADIDAAIASLERLHATRQAQLAGTDNKVSPDFINSGSISE
jgi:hypothetical protein